MRSSSLNNMMDLDNQLMNASTIILYSTLVINVHDFGHSGHFVFEYPDDGR